MTEEIKIRKAINKDLKKISEIFRTEYRKPPYNEKWSEKDSLKKIKEYLKKNYIFVLEIRKEIVGFIIGSTFLWYDGQRGFIDEIVISLNFQGKGLGKKLMNHIEKFFKKKEIKRISLASSKKAKAFKIYKKLGFKEQFVTMAKKLK